MNYDDRRNVNQALGKQMRVGIFDGTQLTILLLYAIFLAFIRMFLPLGSINSIILWFVLSFLTILFLGDKPWKSLRRIVPCPTVMRCGVYYQRLLPLPRSR